MEHTFMTIHSLSPNANILFASDSIFDILGYQPHEILGRSCFDYFHPEEVPFARSVHNRGVQLDKAAVLHYARILSQDGRWVSCECCFTVVHDVLVACTSVYRRGAKSERRALEAPQIRRLFSCSPRDPRYHMLEHLSPKFKTPPTDREPRAALILNRFTRTLTVMFATNAISSILGVSPDQIKDKSFYECIAENCLPEAIRCLESAKANDSIAYLRFWCRDPRRDEDFGDEDMVDGVDGADAVDERRDSHSTSDSDDGGVHLDDAMEIDRVDNLAGGGADAIKQEDGLGRGIHDIPSQADATTSNRVGRGIDGAGQANHQSSSTAPPASSPAIPVGERMRRREPNPSIELEAVVSCTSDGLVVILRRARPAIPAATHPPMVYPTYENGLFAAPWGQQPIRPNYPPDMSHDFRPHAKDIGGPPMDHLMSSIRDVAVFAWGIVGINGNLAQYGHGAPIGDAQPYDGLPIWDPDARESLYLGPEPYQARDWPRRRLPDPRTKSGIAYHDGRYYSDTKAHDPYAGHGDQARHGYDHGVYSHQPQQWGQPVQQPAYELPPPVYQQYDQHDPRHHNANPASTAANYAAANTQVPWADGAAYNQQNDHNYPPPPRQDGGADGHQRHHWQ